MDLFQAISERRSIRKFKPEAVEEEKLQQLFTAAQLAPSWANTQVTRFYLISDPEVKNQVADCIAPGNPSFTASHDAPHLMVVAAKTGISGFKKGEASTVKGDTWYMFDAGLACQNLTLTAHALGLGTVHVGVVDTDQVHRILNLPPEIDVIELIPIGYRDQEPKMPRRIDLDELVTRI
ncbi:MAG: nitroreductase family protein [Methanomassiliicoccales archaeon]